MTHITEVENNKEYKLLLNLGFVGLVNTTSTDSEIARIARISYQKGTKQTSDDRTLIRYLMRHWHSGPFEFGSMTFHVKCPIIVARQWMRHRTFAYDELSARYSLIENEFYIPEEFGKQSQDNKQGTGEPFGEEDQINIRQMFECVYTNAYGTYKHMVEEDLSREQSRLLLPQGVFTEFFVKCDIRNLMHFIRLRKDSHAQYEIRVYADSIYEMFKESFPLTCEAFDDYVVDAVTFSKQEKEVLKGFLSSYSIEDIEHKLASLNCSKRETKEFIKKLESL